MPLSTSVDAQNVQGPTSAQEVDRLYQANQFAEAAKLYERLVSSNPEDANSALNLADCYEEIGAYQRAIAAYQTASKIEAARAFSLYALSKLYLMTKSRAKAIQALNQAIDTGFDDGRTVIRDPLFATLNHNPEYLHALRRLLGPGFTGFDRVEPTKVEMRRGIRLLVSEIRERSPNPYRRFSGYTFGQQLRSCHSLSAQRSLRCRECLLTPPGSD